MDRPRTRLISARLISARLIAAGFLGLAALAGASAGTQLPIRAARWVPPGADMVRALTQKPSECLGKPANAEEAYAIEVGRAAFKTPLVLGGQASRAGVACENCHSGGRTNPQFFFPGVSGKPGTADVTTSVFSSHRGDGIDNPKVIPDLSGPRDRLKISRDPHSAELKTFIHGLVTQEFDGAEPSPAVLAGLAAYVRALSPAACSKVPVQAVRMEGLMDDANRAVTAAQDALVRKDSATAIVMLASARTQLGLVNERYAAPSLARERTALAQADLDLRAAQEALRAGGGAVPVQLAEWQSRARALTARLAKTENRSLFDPVQLAAAIH